MTIDGAAFRIEPAGDSRTFVLSGELDMAATDLVIEATGSLAGEGDVVFELAGLTFIDSSGLRAVLQVAERIPEGKLVLRAPTDAVQRVLDIVGLADASPRVVVDA